MQDWILCKSTEEEKIILSKFKNFKNKISTDKLNFPIVIDYENKIIFRCTSISACGAYISTCNKFKTIQEI